MIILPSKWLNANINGYLTAAHGYQICLMPLLILTIHCQSWRSEMIMTFVRFNTCIGPRSRTQQWDVWAFYAYYAVITWSILINFTFVWKIMCSILFPKITQMEEKKKLWRHNTKITILRAVRLTWRLLRSGSACRLSKVNKNIRYSLPFLGRNIKMH